MATFWFVLFVAFVIFSLWITNIQTKRKDELETENWELRRQLRQWKMYGERRKLDDLGDEVDGWLEHLEEEEDWYTEIIRDVDRLLNNDFDTE